MQALGVERADAASRRRADVRRAMPTSRSRCSRVRAARTSRSRAGTSKQACPVVSVADDIDDVRSAARARRAGARQRRVGRRRCRVLARARRACSPRMRRRCSTTIDEIHVAKVGTGGPACALDPSSGARLVGARLARWRVGQAAGRLGSRVVLVPGSHRRRRLLSSRAPGRACCSRRRSRASSASPHGSAANRRDRVTARFPMLRPPHPEGGPGAVRVEVRGRRGSRPGGAGARRDGPSGGRRRRGRRARRSGGRPPASCAVPEPVGSPRWSTRCRSSPSSRGAG